MSNLVTKLVLGQVDILLVAELQSKVEKAVGKFTYKAINAKTLNEVAWEANTVAKQVVGGYKFLNFEDNCFYTLAFMKIKVSNAIGHIEIIPCFVKEESLHDSLKK